MSAKAANDTAPEYVVHACNQMPGAVYSVWFLYAAMVFHVSAGQEFCGLMPRVLSGYPDLFLAELFRMFCMGLDSMLGRDNYIFTIYATSALLSALVLIPAIRGIGIAEVVTRQHVLPCRYRLAVLHEYILYHFGISDAIRPISRCIERGRVRMALSDIIAAPGNPACSAFYAIIVVFLLAALLFSGYMMHSADHATGRTGYLRSGIIFVLFVPYTLTWLVLPAVSAMTVRSPSHG